MWKGTTISEKFGAFFALYDKLTSSATPTPMVEYNSDGQIVIHLNQLIPKGHTNFSLQILFGLLEGCLRNQRWNVTPIQFEAIKDDITERVPGLMCDIGGLFAHEVDIIFGFTVTPAAYRLDHRVKGSTGLMNHTETFIFENIDHLLPTRRKKEAMNEQPDNQNAKAETSSTFTIELNQFINAGVIDMDAVQHYLEACSGDFFADAMDARAAAAAIIPGLPVLTMLLPTHYVKVSFWARREIGHPGWEFKCTPRVNPVYVNQAHFNAGGFNFNPMAGGNIWGQPQTEFSGIFGDSRDAQFRQPNMGMFNGPYGDVDNGMICELLNLYGLTQIQPLPYQARGRNFPAGLELLDLVKERLLSVPRINMFNAGINPGINPNAPGAVVMTRYHRVIPGVTRSGAVGMDLTPPTPLVTGDVLLGSAIDNLGGRVVHIAANYRAGAYAVYDCTRNGNQLQRTEYPKNIPWAGHEHLMATMGLPLFPYQDFTFDVSDTTEETLAVLREHIGSLKLPRGGHDHVWHQVADVLREKPISSSEHVKLNFTLALPEFMPEGLAAALPETPAATNPMPASPCGAWIIHTDLVSDDELPERFWVSKNGTVRNW